MFQVIQENLFSDMVQCDIHITIKSSAIDLSAVNEHRDTGISKIPRNGLPKYVPQWSTISLFLCLTHTQIHHAFSSISSY